MSKKTTIERIASWKAYCPHTELICFSLFSFSPSISSSTVRRLMGAVSFGYGLFHLAVSLLPNKLLNVVHLLGFEGDRQTGIQALLFSRQGSDMRAPIATYVYPSPIQFMTLLMLVSLQSGAFMVPYDRAAFLRPRRVQSQVRRSCRSKAH